MIYGYVWSFDSSQKLYGECNFRTFKTSRVAINHEIRDVAVVRALASRQWGPGSIPRLGVICGLGLLILYSAPRGFSPVTRVSPLLKNQHLT